MTTKEYLLQIINCDKMINAKLSEVFQLRSLVSSISTVQREDVVQTTRSTDRLGDCVSKIVDLENSINELIDERIEKRNLITSQIETLDNQDEVTVLYMKYVCNNTFEEIAKATSYSDRQIFRFHGYALENFRKKYENLYKMS